jgi:hypothetical protein
MFNDDIGETVLGYATTEEKAKKMIEVLSQTDGFEDYEYEYYWVYVDAIIMNGNKIEF